MENGDDRATDDRATDDRASSAMMSRTMGIADNGASYNKVSDKGGAYDARRQKCYAYKCIAYNWMTTPKIGTVGNGAADNRSTGYTAAPDDGHRQRCGR